MFPRKCRTSTATWRTLFPDIAPRLLASFSLGWGRRRLIRICWVSRCRCSRLTGNVSRTLWTSARGQARRAGNVSRCADIRGAIPRRALAYSPAARCRTGEDRPGAHGDEPARLHVLSVFSQSRDGDCLGSSYRRRLLSAAKVRSRRVGDWTARGEPLVSGCARPRSRSADLARCIESKGGLGSLELGHPYLRDRAHYLRGWDLVVCSRDACARSHRELGTLGVCR